MKRNRTIDSDEDKSYERSSPSNQSSAMIEYNQSLYDANAQDIYQVQAIIDKRYKNRKVQYLIKWKDWDQPEHNTWQGIENLKNVMNLIQQFQQNIKRNKKSDLTKNIQKHSKQSRNQAINLSKRQRKKQLEGKYNKDTKQKKNYIQKQTHQKEREQEKQKGVRKKNLMDSDQQQQVVFMSTRAPYEQIQKRTSLKRIQSQNGSKIQFSKQVSSNLSQKLNSYQKLKQIQTIGYINDYIIQENKIWYDVDILNEKGFFVGVRKVNGDELREQQSEKLRKYLQQQLVYIERFQQMKVRTINSYKKEK